MTNKIAINTKDAEFIREAWNVPNCRTVIGKYREVRKNGKVISLTKRYFVSSLNASVVSAERFLVLVCGHWQVETRLHLIKDRWWNEDIHALFRPGLGEIGSALTNLAVSLLWWGGEKGKSLPKQAMVVEHLPRLCLKNFGY
jgi:hypothetical protein